MGTYSLCMTVWMEFISCCPTERMPHAPLMVTRRLNINLLCTIGHKGDTCAFVGGRKLEKKKQENNYNLSVKGIKWVINRCFNSFIFVEMEAALCWQWFPEACHQHLPPFFGIPVVCSFSVDEEAEDEEAAAIHRDVWESSCNLWPLPKHQVSYLVI